MGLKVEDQVEDLFQDEVGRCLRELHRHRTWTSEKLRLYDELMRLVQTNGYLSFKGDFRDYHLERKAQSCIYVVPQDQRGALQRFKGNRIRLICAGATDRYAGRVFLANTVAEDSPDIVAES